MSTYAILNHNTNKLEFFDNIQSLLNYFGLNNFKPNTEALLEKGIFLLKITVQSFDKIDIKSNPYDNTLILVEHEYLVPLPLFLQLSQPYKDTRDTLSIWNCIIPQYSELLNRYSENILGITPFDINYSIYHSFNFHPNMLHHDKTVNRLKSILTAYKQEYLTNDS